MFITLPDSRFVIQLPTLLRFYHVDLQKKLCWTFHIQARILTSATKQFSHATLPLDLEQVHPARANVLLSHILASTRP